MQTKERMRIDTSSDYYLMIIRIVPEKGDDT